MSDFRDDNDDDDDDDDYDDDSAEIARTFVELESDDDLSATSIDSVFGIKSNDFIYFIQFRKSDAAICDYSFFLKICDEHSDGEDDELLTWTFISLNHFFLIQHLVHTLRFLSDKIADYFFASTSNENCQLFTASEVNSFLLILSDAAEEDYPELFISSVFHLNKDFLDIVRAFDNLAITYDDIIVFFTKSQILFDACCIYLDFAYYELSHLHRTSLFSDQLVTNLTRTISTTICEEESLKSSFIRRFSLLSQ